MKAVHMNQYDQLWYYASSTTDLNAHSHRSIQPAVTCNSPCATVLPALPGQVLLFPIFHSKPRRLVAPMFLISHRKTRNHQRHYASISLYAVLPGLGVTRNHVLIKC